METATYVLYTNKSYTTPGELCPGSKECVRLAANRPDILVQNVDTILASGVELPPWLDGTPTVVDMAKSAASKGDAAIKLLESLGGTSAPVPKPTPMSHNDDKLSAADMEALIKERRVPDEPVQSRPPPAPIEA